MLFVLFFCLIEIKNVVCPLKTRRNFSRQRMCFTCFTFAEDGVRVKKNIKGHLL